jgi:hypothetical protein
MNVLALLLLLFIFPLILFLGTKSSLMILYFISNCRTTAFLALSSCLGSDFRGRYGLYNSAYLRTMTNTGPSASEHIELEAMLDGSDS